ncbi:hypothetical protein BDQ17DRAFT_91693 [Cyathus striatus]|nr:hypothetical protein BDQ17DRAFT_91693 [Cyathus striatus]
MDGPAVIDYADSIISWFTSGVRRQCINICKPAAKVLPQHLSTRTFSVTSKTDENVRLQCQKQVTQLESDWNDIQRMTRARATRSREIKQMREKLTSLLESRNEVRKEIGDLKASLRNIIPDPNSMDVDTSSISFPLDNSQISSLAGYIARNQVSPLLQNLAEDCKAGLSASTKILYEGVWEKLAMPLAVAAVACDTLPQECMPKQ